MNPSINRDVHYEDWPNKSEMGINVFEKFLLNFLLKQKKVNPILDVGCGSGIFMEFLKSQRFDIDGFDISEVAVGLAKKKGLNVKCSSIKNFNPERKYKTILLIATLPWVDDTEGDFKKVASWLEDGGIMFVTVRNSLSIKYLFGSKNYLVTGKYHPNYFQFKKFANSNGLKIKSVKALGKGVFFPYLATIPIYILEKK